MKIGMASIDENGKISAGKAGDQNGNEVKICNWYNKPWNVIIRAKDPKKAKAMAEAMKAACNNNNIGYDQWERVSLLNKLEKNGFNFATVDACETDCSALVATIIIATGTPKSKMMVGTNLPVTSNLESKCKATGEFEFLRESKYLTSGDYLKAGDILLNTNHHAAMAVEDGSKANSTSTPATTTPSTPRTLQKGCKGEDVKTLQKNLNTVMKSGLTVDGDFGAKTDAAVRAFQKKYNLEVDGKFGPKSRAKMEEVLKTPVVEPAKPTFVAYKAKVNTPSGLNVRTGPGTNYTRLGGLINGSVVTVYEVSANNWGRIGDKQWISLSYTQKV